VMKLASASEVGSACFLTRCETFTELVAKLEVK